jgi:NAD(P)-dependent dehydrogenase (short-subunit alcohol dehydrogenase family)
MSNGTFPGPVRKRGLLSLDFQGRVVVVTGAGRGMGAAHANELARRGARVVVNDLGAEMDGHGHDAQPAEQVATAIRDAGGEAVAHSGSVASAQGCDDLIAMALAAYGRLDGVLHNAGNVSWLRVEDMTEQALDDVLDVHAGGAMHLTRAAWPHLRERGGRILYITSGAALYGTPTLGHYGIAKAGVVGLARVVAAEGRDEGIAANALAVAASTRMMDSVLAPTPHLLEWFRTYMHPHLPSAAAVWLLHPDCPANGNVYEAYGPHVARVLIAETEGFTKLDMTAEDVRDHFEQIESRDELVIPDDVDEFNLRMFEFIVAAGAAPPQPDDVSDDGHDPMRFPRAASPLERR